jgi:hypothetical protein
MSYAVSFGIPQLLRLTFENVHTDGDVDYGDESVKPKANHDASSSSMPESVSKTTTLKKDPTGVAGDGDKEGASSSSLYRIDSGLLPFPEKLMALLDGNQVSGT